MRTNRNYFILYRFVMFLAILPYCLYFNLSTAKKYAAHFVIALVLLIRTVCPSNAHTNRSFDLPLHLSLCPPSLSLSLTLYLTIFLSLCLISLIIRCIYFIGTRHAAVPALRFPLGHGGTTWLGRRDAPGTGTPLRPVPVPLPVHQGASAVQTPRQVQVLQYSALGDGI